MADAKHELNLAMIGMPGAGKSSLLGAFVQAADKQKDKLDSRLARADEGIVELHKGVYQNKLKSTDKEVSPHYVVFESPQGQRKVHVIDGSGEASESLLKEENLLESKKPLAKHLQKADGVLFMVDASVEPTVLDETFRKAIDFLKRFRAQRGQRHDVAGLPVHLVLTKCDMLARKTDTHQMWLQRVEEGKKKIEHRFRSALAANKDLGFGAIDLSVWPTSVRMPAVTDRPAKPQEPFGVAELFSHAVRSAASFHEKVEDSSRLLSSVLIGLIAAVALLAIVTGAFFLTRPSPELALLETRVHESIPSARERLAEPLDERLKKLNEIRENSAWPNLPDKLKKDVEDLIAEIQDYQSANKSFVEKISDPRFATRDEELTKIEKELAEFNLPDKYAKDWAETKLAKRAQAYREEITRLRDAVVEEEKWTVEQVQQGEKLKAKGGLVIARNLTEAERMAWFGSVKEYLEREPRHKRTDRVTPQSAVTYQSVYHFNRVEKARKDWDRTKDALRNLRNLAQ
jgi:GTPase SAR1 family protein